MSAPAFARTILFEGLLEAARRHGAAKPVLEDAREPAKSYAELIKSAVGAARIASKVAAEGEIFGVLLPNLSGTAALVLGAGAAGRIPAMLNYSAGPQGIAWACQAASIRRVITSRRFVETIKLDVTDPLLAAITFLYIEDLRAQLTLGDKLWLALWAWPKPQRIVRQRDPDAVALVLFTSGSEGRPKGVAITHANVFALREQLAHVLPFDPATRWFSPLPMFHSYGLLGTVLTPLLSGFYVYVHLSPLDFREIPKKIAEKKPTALFGSTYLLSQYARMADPDDLRSLQYVVAGGEMLSEEVVELYRTKFGLACWEGYGSTETSCAVALNTGAVHKADGTVGPLLPGMEARIEPVPGLQGRGVLHVRGPNVMKGYYLAEQPGVLVPTSSSFGPGWCETGDVVDMTADGRLRIEGRMKRFAKIAGELVSLDLIERVARRASPDARHAATARLLPTGETTILFTTDPGLSRAQLAAKVRELGVHDLAVARQIARVDGIPVLPNGKTDYIQLRRHADALTPAEGAAA
jgi:acyl-[acyl-carrier-protein]-phospholipid O-acyltransferase/long-chain-fatty-acid--[acyl-carrier-protein] ligase